MAHTLKLRQALIVDGQVVLGDKNVDQDITLSTGRAYCSTQVTVADNYGTATLWTTGDGGLTTFTHGFILSDQDLVVELRTDNGTPEYASIFVKANVLTFIPAKTSGNTTETLDGAILVDGTDFDDVDRIEVQRDVADAIGDATVDLWLFA